MPQMGAEPGMVGSIDRMQ